MSDEKRMGCGSGCLIVIGFLMLAFFLTRLRQDRQEVRRDDAPPRKIERQSKSSLDVSREEFEGDWPFTVDTVKLRCETPSMAIVEIHGLKFAINGQAQQKYPNIDGTDFRPRMEDGTLQGSLADLIRLALELCP